MAASRKSRRICPRGHRYDKSSDCPTCPFCERERAPAASFMSALAAPARRALEGAGILTLKSLAARREDDVLALHGMGPNAMAKLRALMDAEGLRFGASSGNEGAARNPLGAKRAPAGPKPRGMNAKWHRDHPMPRNAGLPRRAAWHEAHARACGCRKMPATVAAYLKKR